MRNLLRIVWSALIRISPPWLEYRLRYVKELLTFANCANVHELPPIFHYWSNKYLGPQIFNPVGIRDPEQFFLKYISEYHARNPQTSLEMVSLGCGNCDMECRLAQGLVAAGIDRFRIECVDINTAMLERGLRLANALGVAGHIRTTVGDFNQWRPAQQYHIVIANQCLHHVVALESLFAGIHDALVQDGRFLVSDMIGRNGHQRWPEALEVVNGLWSTLADRYKYNHIRRRMERNFINHDCSVSSFEGIRAQDILPLLIANFRFELFLPFGNLVFVFVDRTFGPNFDPDDEADRAFIDRVHLLDEEAFRSGKLKPTQMLAVLGKDREVKTRLRDPLLTPEFCVRVPD